MSVTEDSVINAINSFTGFSCQTETEYSAGLNTSADILYSGSSKTQSNFSESYKIAQIILEDDLSQYGITLTDEETVLCLAYLIAHLHERKFPDWNATDIKSDTESLSREESPYYAAYKRILESKSTASSKIVTFRSISGISWRY